VPPLQHLASSLCPILLFGRYHHRTLLLTSVRHYCLSTTLLTLLATDLAPATTLRAHQSSPQSLPEPRRSQQTDVGCPLTHHNSIFISPVCATHAKACCALFAIKVCWYPRWGLPFCLKSPFPTRAPCFVGHLKPPYSCSSR
jgi:hypothetical protein